MNSFATADLLTAWERGSQQPRSRRLLPLLATVHPELSEQELLNLPIGQRDHLVLLLREALFGQLLTSLAVCPSCSEQLELVLGVNDIKIATVATQAPLSLQLEDFELAFRLPNSQDLICIETISTVNEARCALLERCLLSVTQNGEAKTINDLSEEMLDKIETAMSEADPQADVQLDLNCPACQHSWLAVFDIASFFWSELNAWALRVLNEIHLLAKAYAWREADILAMSSTRRQLYLERVMQ